MTTLVLELAPTGKARPRVSGKVAYLPPAYRNWRKTAEMMLAYQWDKPPITGPVSLAICIFTPSGNMRPDIDNAAGAIMDALQGAGIIENDKQVRRLSVDLARGKASIEIDLEEL